MKYISKGQWFKKGTECQLIEDYRDKESEFKLGLFEGIFVIDDESWLKVKHQWKNNKVGDEVVDREVCGFDEFEIIEEK